MNLALGVDIGGTNVRVAVVETGGGTILESERAVLPGTSVEQVEGTVAGLVKTLEGVLPLAGVPVGVGFAGMLQGGVVVNAPNLGWRDVEFGERLGRALGRPVRLLNDLTVAAFGEFWAGAARGSTDSFTVFAGTGVGSAIISEGRLLHGATGVAGEFGHVKVVAEGGRPCGCGGEGCLEAYAGGARLLAWMKEEGLPGTVTELEAQAAAGIPKAQGALRLRGGRAGAGHRQPGDGAQPAGGGAGRRRAAARARHGAAHSRHHRAAHLRAGAARRCGWSWRSWATTRASWARRCWPGPDAAFSVAAAARPARCGPARRGWRCAPWRRPAAGTRPCGGWPLRSG